MPPSRTQSQSPDGTPPESQSPPQQPSPSEQDSSKRSRTRASSGGFFADTGPGFDPDARPEPVAPPAPEVIDVGWQEDSVRAILQAKGALLHALVAVEPESEEWVYTDRDLQAIAPPLTRILNRYPATAAAGGTGDEIAVVVGLGGYVTRSYVARRQAMAIRQPEQPQPITGRAPDPGDIPDQPLHPQPSVQPPAPEPAQDEEPFPDPPETGLRSAGPDARRYDR